MLRSFRSVCSSPSLMDGLSFGGTRYAGYRTLSSLNGMQSLLVGKPTINSSIVPFVHLKKDTEEKDQSTLSFQHQQRRGNRTWARRQALRKRFENDHKRMQKPSLAMATAIPTSFSGMDNASLVVMGRMGIHGANKEILKRHIMTVDQVSYDVAEEKYALISDANKEYMFMLALPYQIGIATAVTMGVFSLPMVFHYGTAEWFNHLYVTTDVPEQKDLETYLEVGAWTWNWMEPVLGTLSFFLLTFQFSRAQLDNLGVKPYTHKVKQWRAERLAEKFPQYDVNVVIAYSKSATIHSSSKNNYSY